MLHANGSFPLPPLLHVHFSLSSLFSLPPSEKGRPPIGYQSTVAYQVVVGLDTYSPTEPRRGSPVSEKWSKGRQQSQTQSLLQLTNHSFVYLFEIGPTT